MKHSAKLLFSRPVEPVKALQLFVSVSIVWVAAPLVLAAQQQHKASDPWRFDAAVIRMADPKLGEYAYTSGGRPGGLYRMVNVPLDKWIELGFSVKGNALKGPKWTETARFDLNARLPNDPLSENQLPEMMKNLLVERFGIKWHEETESESAYELVTDKKVLVKETGLLERLKGHGSGSGPTFINGVNMQMSELARALEVVLGKPVIDSTKLTAGYDITVIWRPVDDASAAREKQNGIDVDNLPATVFDAVREQLGLRIQNTKVQSKIIVVDHIESKPVQD